MTTLLSEFVFRIASLRQHSCLFSTVSLTSLPVSYCSPLHFPPTFPSMKEVMVEFHVIIGKDKRQPENNPGLLGMLAWCPEKFFFSSLTLDLTFPLMRSHMLMLSLNFTCSNSPMEALIASSANEYRTVTFCRKGKKKNLSPYCSI